MTMLQLALLGVVAAIDMGKSQLHVHLDEPAHVPKPPGMRENEKLMETNFGEIQSTEDQGPREL